MRRGSKGSLRVRYASYFTSRVKLTTEDLVGTFSGENHLDTHSLDFSAEKVHWRGSSDGRDVVSLEVVDDLWNRVETFLNGKGVFVVDSAEEVGGLLRGDQVGRAGQTNGE